MSALAVVAAALVAALLGWFALPAVVARLPERADLADNPHEDPPEDPPDDDVALPAGIATDAGTERRAPARPAGAAAPARPTYAQVAVGRRAPPVLAGLLAALWVLPLARPTDLPAGAYPAYLWLTTVGLALAWVDVHTHKLPDALTAPALLGTAALLAVGASTGAGTWGDYGRAWLAALAMLAGYLLAALIYPAGLGLGDVKLAPSLGMILGWSGWSTALLGWFAGYLVGALVGVTVVLVRRASLKTAVPFGPAMLGGAWLALLWGPTTLAWYTGG